MQITTPAGSALKKLSSSNFGGQTGQAWLLEGDLCCVFRVILMVHDFSPYVLSLGADFWCRVSYRAVWICDVNLKILIREGGAIGLTSVSRAVTDTKSIHVFRKPHSQIQGVITSFSDTVGILVLGWTEGMGQLWLQHPLHVTVPEQNIGTHTLTPEERSGGLPQIDFSLV